MVLRALYYALFAAFASSTASGYDTWTCRPSQHNTAYTVSGQTAPFFGIRLLDSNGSTASGYTPSIAQTVELYAVATGAKIAGVTAAAFTGSSTCPTSCGTVVGSFSAPTGVSYLRQMSRCTGGMTQSSRQASSSFKFAWTAPSTQADSVSIWAIVVGAGDTYVAVSANFAAATTAVSVESVSATPTATPTATQSQALAMSSTPSPTTLALESRTNTRVRTASNTPTTTPIIPASVSASTTPTAVAPVTQTPTSSSTSSRAQALGANYIPSSDTATTSSALSTTAVIIAGSLAVATVLCMIYHYVQKGYRSPKTIMTKMPEAIKNMDSKTFYKRTDGKDVWFVNCKTMESSWSLPTGAVLVAELP